MLNGSPSAPAETSSDNASWATTKGKEGKIKRPIYMDYQATTPTDPRVVDEMLPYFTERFGNSSSQSHMYGWESQFAIEKARAALRWAINAKEDSEIVFTGGATESNNLAIKGVVEEYFPDGLKHVVTVCTEHSAVLGPCQYLVDSGADVTFLPVTSEGAIDMEELRKSLRDDTGLVSVMMANNETGVVHPLKEIAALVKKHSPRSLVHSDAVQALGKVQIDVQDMNLDLVSMSGHKIYGPKGVGALYVRRRNPSVRLSAQVHGGGQELGRRAGTLATPLIVGFGRAVEIAIQELKEGKEERRLRDLKQALWEGLAAVGGVHINGSLHPRASLPACLNVAFEGVDGGRLLKRIQSTVAVSSGSACTSGDSKASHVLLAMGLPEHLAKSSLRFGIGRFTTTDDVTRVIEAVSSTVEDMRRSSPLSSS
mmetsp:Transcript_16312/g.26936  ORF Transcript_16312/g.26936 Transcript_16312/m.26936 type:complete len:426 (-) Transcript_16312:347-1624(-)